VKKCSKCNKLKDIGEFHHSSISKDGRKPSCKVCRNTANKKHRDANPEYFQKWRDEHKDEIKAHNEAYYSKHKDKLNKKRVAKANLEPTKTKAYKKAWYEANRKKILANKKKRYENNREEIIQREMKYRENNPLAKLRHILRSRFKRALNGNYKNGSAIRDLGCSIEFLKSYLENKFAIGMSWENYGEWHIDHIMPLASFDLTDRDQVKQACHYTNLQPLWAEDNLKKGTSIPKE